MQVSGISRRWIQIALLLCALAAALAFYGLRTALSMKAAGTPAPTAKYAVLAWNDLGMHCYNGSFADMLVLPPYNTLWAEVVEVADPPRVVTTGIKVSYEFDGNTYSAGKTDFWEYATQLFSLPTTLPPNVGLKGKGLKGDFDIDGDHFTAVGIPLTEYSDEDTATRNPLQMATITVRDATTDAVLATASVVAPVSSEMGCATCHADDADATTRYPITPTGDFQQNILAIHDYLSQSKYPAGHTAPLLGRRPVLCAECHADAALGLPGIAGVSNLSNAMHKHHNPDNAPDIGPNNDGCYNCHPGADTKCLRCAMSQRYSMGCVDCHGDITQVAKNPKPWVTEPQCGNSACHGAGYLTDQPLYRNSKGHGGLYCPTCHDSPHAIASSRESSDAVKFVQLQGYAGTLRECTVCHATAPSAAFAHGSSVPPAPKQPAYLSAPSAKSAVRAYRSFTVSGVLAPKHAKGDRSVQLTVRRYWRGKWMVYRNVWATNINRATYTQYVATLRLKPGTYRIYATASEDSGHLKTVAPTYKRVSVR